MRLQNWDGDGIAGSHCCCLQEWQGLQAYWGAGNFRCGRSVFCNAMI